MAEFEAGADDAMDMGGDGMDMGGGGMDFGGGGMDFGGGDGYDDDDYDDDDYEDDFELADAASEAKPFDVRKDGTRASHSRTRRPRRSRFSHSRAPPQCSR